MNELDKNAQRYDIPTLDKKCRVCCHPYKDINKYKICKECWNEKGYKELVEKQK